MKLGVIGLGYWGTNVFNTLSKTNDKDLVLCDPYLDQYSRETYKGYDFCEDYRDLGCDSVFIIIPPALHYEVCRHFLDKGVNVFCEKPLCFSLEEATDLYERAEKNGCKLFVDWICTFTNELNFIKRDYDRGRFGGVKSIFSERLALGPIRDDVDARWDLSSHDISVIAYMFEGRPEKTFWSDSKRNKKSSRHDSCCGVLHYDNFYAILNASWEFIHGKKRRFVFEFDKVLVEWDDIDKSVKYNDHIVARGLSGLSPLERSIDTFLSCDEGFIQRQKRLTLDVTGILNEC